MVDINSFFLLVFVAFVMCGCTMSIPITFHHGRIAYGTSVTVGRTAFYVRLLSDFRQLCGGSLITRNRVVTAGHCVDGRSMYEYTLVFGYISDKFKTGQQKRIVNRRDVILHPKYVRRSLANDIAIIKFSYPVEISRYVDIVAIDRTYLDEDTALITTGAGLNGNRKRPNVLQWAKQISISNEECAEAYNRTKILSTTVCTVGMFGNESLCNGDSGGPLMYWLNKTPQLVGVASFGGGQSLGCTKGIPSGFTRISSHLDFIDENVR